MDISDRSLATTTATIRSRVSKVSRLRARIDENLRKKGKTHSIPVPAPISAPVMSKTSIDEELDELPEESVYPDMDAGMLEDLDETLEQIQEGNRKRPRGLLLGKSPRGYIITNSGVYLNTYFRHIFSQYGPNPLSTVVGHKAISTMRQTRKSAL